jgi:2'-5' RNA ligase
MKRTFIGFKIESDSIIIRLFEDLKKNLSHSQLSWVDPKNLHLTLRFLGNTEESQIKAINQKLDHLISRISPFELEIKGLGFFGNRSYPRVIWAGILMPEAIFNLVKEIENVLEEEGFEREMKAYSPHLTLARVKNLVERDAFSQMILKYKSTSFNKQTIREIIFYESILGRSGSVYQPIRTFELKT